jgi:formate dehydrogenase major subunit
MLPLQIDGETIHQVGLPYHWGWKGMVTGDVVNDLLVISQEPNVRIMETKGLVCNLIAGRRENGNAALQQLAELLQERT